MPAFLGALTAKSADAHMTAAMSCGAELALSDCKLQLELTNTYVLKLAIDCVMPSWSPVDSHFVFQCIQRNRALCDPSLRAWV